MDTSIEVVVKSSIREWIMFRFFARRVAVNTAGVVASAAIANGSYAAGAAAYDYGLNKFETITNNSHWNQPLSSSEQEECVRAVWSPTSY